MGSTEGGTKRTAGRGARRREAMRQMRLLLQRFRGVLDENLEPLGVTTAQLQVLHQISVAAERTGDAVGAPQPLSGAGVARLCGVTPQTVQALLVRSERAGLVRRRGDPANERLVLWSLTPAGKRVLERAETIFDGVLERAWTGVGTAEVRQVTRVIEQCVGNLRGE